MFGEQANLPIQSTCSSYLNKPYLLLIIIKKKIINVKWKRIISKEIPFFRTNFLHIGYSHFTLLYFTRTHQIFLSVAWKKYIYNNNSIKIIEKWLTRENKWNKNFYSQQVFPQTISSSPLNSNFAYMLHSLHFYNRNNFFRIQLILWISFRSGWILSIKTSLSWFVTE